MACEGSTVVTGEHKLLRALLVPGEGRAVWDAEMAGRLDTISLAALAATCKAGRDYRRERVAQDGADVLVLKERLAFLSVGKLRTALDLGYKIHLRTVQHAARFGTVEVLKWMLKKKYDILDILLETWEKFAWEGAAKARSSRVEKLEVLHERIPGTWDVTACAIAAKYGHVDALRWLHRHGAPWDEETCYEAAAGGHVAALEYAVLHCCPANLLWCYDIALKRGHQATASWVDAIID